MESSINDMEAGVTAAGKTITNVQQRDYLDDDEERLLGVVVGAIDAPTPVLVSRPKEHEQLLTEKGGDRGRKEEKETGGEKELVTAGPRADNADATGPLTTSTQKIDTGRRYWVAAGAAWWPSMREATEAVGSWEVLGLLVTQVVCTAAILVGESLAVSWVVGGVLAIVVCVLTGLCLNECRETWEVLGLLVTQVVCTAAILVGESLAVSWVVGGVLAIVVCVFMRPCLKECRKYGCGDSDTQRYALIALLSLLGLAAHGTLMLTVAGWASVISLAIVVCVLMGLCLNKLRENCWDNSDTQRYALIALLSLLGLAAHGTLMLTVAGWASVISCMGLAGMGYVGGLVVLVWKRCKKGEWDSRWMLTFALALWIAALTVVPAVLFTWAGFATSSHATSTLGACGVIVFITALWMLGWAFLWYRGEKLQPIAGNQHLATLPPVTLQRLKLFTVLSECYNYCGFSYFPALPWKAMVVPPKVPHPQIVMLAGFFYFDDVDTHFWIFLGASVTVVLSFVLLGLTLYFDKPQRQDLVVQIFFDLLSFPLIKQLSGVFSCTSASVWIESTDKLSGTIEAARFCDTGTVSMDMQCMDNDPSVQCWGGQHRSYIVAVLALLVPYYVAALELQRSAQARQTVVKIDGGWLVVTVQSKFLLAVIASSFGECFPIVMVASVEAVTLSQLIMLCCGVDFSNVHSLNAVRMGGVLAAAFNGMYATFALWHFRDDPAARPPCTMTAPNNGIDGSSSSLQSTAKLQLVNDYSTFFGLIGVNVGAIAYGFWWWWQRRSSWLGKSATTSSATTASQFPSLDSINTDASAREVDYPIVESRLRAVDDLIASWPEVSADARSQPGFLFELYTIEAHDGDVRPQELESATMDLVLDCASLAAPHGVSLLGIDSATKSGQLVLKELKKIATGRRKCAARVACMQLVAVRNIEIQPLLDALQNSSLTSLSLAGAGIRVDGVTAIATVIPTMAAINSLTVDSTGSPKLTRGTWAAKEASGPRTYTLTAGEETIDLGQKNLGPADVTLLTTWIQRPEVSAALNSLNMSGNFPAGRISKDNDGRAPWLPGKDFDAWTAVCDAVHGSQITEWNISECYLGPDAMTILSTRLSAALEVLAVGNNPIGSEGGSALVAAVKTSNLKIIDIGKPLPVQEPYESQTLDVSQTGMGPGQVVILSWWLTTPFSAVIARVNVLSNPIGADGADALIEAFNQNTNLRTLLGIEEGVTEVNLSEKNVDPGQAKILATELKASRAAAAVKKVVLSNNFIFGTKMGYNDEGYKITVHDVDADQSGWITLCGALPGSPVEELIVADIGMGVTGVTSLAKAISAGAVLASVNLSGNRAIDQESRSALQESVSSRQPTIELIWDK